MPVSADHFRSALSHFASGVTVVTTKDASGKLHGITVSAFCSVSLEPPLVLICIEKTTGSHHAFEESGFFSVNILSSERSETSEHFASMLPDKFEGVDVRLDSRGVPSLPEALATLECKLSKALDGGDHSIFLGEVENVIIRNGDPLLYYRGEYRTINSD
ncbi:MAG TPA: flavin reductase family protein [Pyrinomonadaceae bacterium]|nr:flavin reductase family protein [Pyrinomonadaceae bacterium]